MSTTNSATSRGRLSIGLSKSKTDNVTTIDMPTKDVATKVMVENDPALGILSLEERFEDKGEIARGGMGSIHQVLEHTLNRTVAMKILPMEQSHEKKVRQRFIAEAQVTAQLQHPNIVPVYEIGSDDDGKLFFTMRLVQGRTLAQVLKEHKGESDEEIEQVMEIFFKVCDALSFAHSRGVIHRDIKPSNIMVGDFGEVYLMDWGVARLLNFDEKKSKASLEHIEQHTTLTIPAMDERGLVVGTYNYMAPEQAKAELDKIDERTDVFSMGAVLFRVVSGKAPIGGDSLTKILQNATNSKITDVRHLVHGSLRKSLLEVAYQAMRKCPAQRFQSISGLKRAARSVVRGRLRFPVKRFSPGQMVIEEGQKGYDAYYIRSGSCKVFKHQGDTTLDLKTLGPGEVFGETAIFTGQHRNASVKAISDVELIVVPASYLSNSLNLDEWTGAFVRSLGQRFTLANQRQAELEVELSQSHRRCDLFKTMALFGSRESNRSIRIATKDLLFNFGASENEEEVFSLLKDEGFKVQIDPDDDKSLVITYEDDVGA